MAFEADFQYFRFLHDQGEVVGPVLEVGGRSWQGEAGNLESVCRELGVQWEAADISEDPGVSIVLDILDTDAVMSIQKRWPTVAVFNLLEHVYDPVTALRNALALVAEGGRCVVAGPAVWQLHRFPADFWRPMPDFYFEFGRREGFGVSPALVRWLMADRVICPDDLLADGEWSLPSAHHSPEVWGPRKALRSRIVHRLFRTYGRSSVFPYVSLGVTLRKS